jgi:hypothetical protein
MQVVAALGIGMQIIVQPRKIEPNNAPKTGINTMNQNTFNVLLTGEQSSFLFILLPK